MATPSRILVHHYEGKTLLTLPGGRTRWCLRCLHAAPLKYEVIVHRLKPDGWVGRYDLPVIFTGAPLQKMLRYLAAKAEVDHYCWLRCLRIP